jgi:methylase of polypeptide subunit release factors
MPETDGFKHSTPALYDRYMGPLLFEPYAKLVAKRTALLQPARILETAAGSGIVTEALHGTVPDAEIVATDINPQCSTSLRSRSARAGLSPTLLITAHRRAGGRERCGGSVR